MADENNAQFGVEIPPVKGINEAIKDFDRLTESVKRLGDAVTGLGNKLNNVKPAGPAGDLQKMQGAASQLLMTMGPLGQQAALLQQRFSGMGSALGGLTSLSAGAVIGIGLAVTALLALAAAAMAVKKAFDIMTEAVKAAAKFQQTADLFGDFIGNAKEAGAELDKLKKLWHDAGVFKLDDLVETATRMKSLGADTSHLTELTEAMAKAAKAGTGDIKGMTEAFASLMAGRIRGAPSIDQLTLIRAIAVQSKGPMESLDQAVARTTLSIKKHEIATEDMAKALVKAGQAGGIFASQIDDEKTMFEGASAVMSQRWDEFMLALGQPIIDALTPIMLRWADTLDQLIPKGKEWGEGVGGMITKIDSFASALDNVITKLEKIPGLLEAMKAVMRTIPLIGPVISAATTGLQVTHDILTPPTGPGGIPKPAGIDTIKAPGPMPGKLGDWIKTHEDKGTGSESDWEKYKSDLKLLSDYWEEYGIIQSKATTATEAQYRQMQAIDKIIPTLGDPLAHLGELMQGLGPSDAALVKWKVLNEVATRTLKNIEDRAKANQATMAEVWQAGLKKMTDAWGSFQEQMINGIGEIGNALVSDISGGLMDILNGTKSVKDGFREMALAIVQDIERIIIKMLVQLAIQQLISAFGGGGGYANQSISAGADYGNPNYIGLGTPSYQGGGAVGGTGRGDKVPAMLEPGEFVIPRDSAERIGYGQLEKMRTMAQGGRVLRMATGGGVPDLSGADLRMTTYGPGSPNPTGADLRERTGLGGMTLRPGDAALSLATARAYHLQPGDIFTYNGVTYRYADRPAGKVGNVLDIFYGKKGAPGGGDPFTGKHTQGHPKDPGGTAGKHLIGFDSHGKPITIDDLGGRHGGFDLGDVDRGNRPGFPDFGSPLGNVENLTPGERINYYIGPDGRVTVESVGFGGSPTSGGVPAGSQIEPGGFTGGSPFVSHSNAPTGYDAQGNPVYGGQPGGFNIPGGINWSPGSPGGNLGGMTAQLAMFHGVWSGRRPMSFNTWQAGAGTPQAWASMPGGTYANYLSTWDRLRSSGTTAQGRLGYGQPTAHFEGQGPGGAGRPMTQNRHEGGMIRRYHEGGVVDAWGEYQSGGTVKRGEGVFTPEQMASMQPAGGTQVNQITIAINNQGGRTDARAEGSGLNDKDAREMARAMLAVCKAQIEKEKRSGGSLYLSRSQRGG